MLIERNVPGRMLLGNLMIGNVVVGQDRHVTNYGAEEVDLGNGRSVSILIREHNGYHAKGTLNGKPFDLLKGDSAPVGNFTLAHLK